CKGDVVAAKAPASQPYAQRPGDGAGPRGLGGGQPVVAEHAIEIERGRGSIEALVAPSEEPRNIMKYELAQIGISSGDVAVIAFGAIFRRHCISKRFDCLFRGLTLAFLMLPEIMLVDRQRCHVLVSKALDHSNELARHEKESNLAFPAQSI